MIQRVHHYPKSVIDTIHTERTVFHQWHHFALAAQYSALVALVPEKFHDVSIVQSNFLRHRISRKGHDKGSL